MCGCYRYVKEGPFEMFKRGKADEIKGLQPGIKDIKGDEVWDRSEFNATYRMYEQYYPLDNAAKDEVRRDWMRTLDNTAISADELPGT